MTGRVGTGTDGDGIGTTVGTVAVGGFLRFKSGVMSEVPPVSGIESGGTTGVEVVDGGLVPAPVADGISKGRVDPGSELSFLGSLALGMETNGVGVCGASTFLSGADGAVTPGMAGKTICGDAAGPDPAAGTITDGITGVILRSVPVADGTVTGVS